MTKIINFLKEVKSELKNVTWPTKNQVVVLTLLIIAISILVAYFLGFWDLIFTSILSKFIF